MQDHNKCSTEIVLLLFSSDSGVDKTKNRKQISFVLRINFEANKDFFSTKTYLICLILGSIVMDSNLLPLGLVSVLFLPISSKQNLGLPGE